jgi:hypothetical protein
MVLNEENFDFKGHYPLKSNPIAVANLQNDVTLMHLVSFYECCCRLRQGLSLWAQIVSGILESVTSKFFVPLGRIHDRTSGCKWSLLRVREGKYKMEHGGPSGIWRPREWVLLKLMLTCGKGGTKWFPSNNQWVGQGMDNLHTHTILRHIFYESWTFPNSSLPQSDPPDFASHGAGTTALHPHPVSYHHFSESAQIII